MTGPSMVGYSRTSDVVTIELQRPQQRNALNHAMVDGIAGAVTRAVDEGARVIVLTGQGTVFCAGADLSGPVYDPTFLEKLLATLRVIDSAPVPVIAAMNGPALGAGLQLAMAADLRVMAPESTIGIPAAKIGVAVDDWTIKRLASLVGGGVARGITLACESLSADRAHDLGFANKIGDLADAQHWAATIAVFAPLSLQHYKLVLNDDGTRDDAPAAHTESMMRAWHSEDLEEGKRARIEKRMPNFTGR